MEDKDIAIVEGSPIIEIVDDKKDDLTTTPEIVAPASQDNAVNAEEKVVEGGEADNGEKPVEADPVLEERKKNAQINKMSMLEKERNEYAKKAEERNVARLQDTLDLLINPTTAEIAKERLAKDPAFFEDFRSHVRKTTGEVIDTYETVFSNQPLVANTQTNGRYVDPETIKQQIKQEMQVEQVRSDAVSNLISFVPEIDPIKGNLTQDDVDLIKDQLEAADLIALRIQRFNPGLSYRDALVEGWNSLPENRTKQIAQAKEAGELIGRGKALASGIGSSASPSGSGGSPIKSSTYKMTRVQQEFYEDMKQTDPVRAEKYAQRATKLNS